jgi:ATP/maltotriose-dependent transcriptional regulator MalT
MGQLEPSERFLIAVEQAVRDNTGNIPREAELMGHSIGTRAGFAAYRGDIQEAITLGEEAWQYIPEDDYLMRCRLHESLGLAHLLRGETTRGAQ